MFEDSLTPCSSDTSPFRGTKGREARETLTRDEEKKSTKSCSRRDAESVEKLKTKTMGREGKGREGKGREEKRVSLLSPSTSSSSSRRL